MFSCFMLSLIIMNHFRIAFHFFFFSSRRRHTRFDCDWSSDVCSSDLFPPEQGFIHRFLNPAVEVPGAAERLPAIGTIVLLAAISIVAGLVGIAIGLSMYVRHRPDPAAIARASGPYYRVLLNKYYLDELYDHRVVEAARAFAGASWAFDIH